ncbi:hypothetical protein KDK77_04735, partial [bacterium]|nr:hypothetical protein [bacterium]
DRDLYIFDVGTLSTNPLAAIITITTKFKRYKKEVIQRLSRQIPAESVAYYQKRFDEVFTVRNFIRHWKTGLPIPAPLITMDASRSSKPNGGGTLQPITVQVKKRTPESDLLKKYIENRRFKPFLTGRYENSPTQSLMYRDESGEKLFKMQRPYFSWIRSLLPDWFSTGRKIHPLLIPLKHLLKVSYLLVLFTADYLRYSSGTQLAYNRLGGLIPRMFIVSPETKMTFNEDGLKYDVEMGYIQDRLQMTVSRAIVILNDDGQRPNVQAINRIFDAFFTMQEEMLRRGVWDIDGKILNNYGLNSLESADVQFFDFGRLTANPLITLFSITRRKKIKEDFLEKIRPIVPAESLEYYSSRFDEVFSVSNFFRLWRKGAPQKAETIDIEQELSDAQAGQPVAPVTVQTGSPSPESSIIARFIRSGKFMPFDWSNQNSRVFKSGNGEYYLKTENPLREQLRRKIPRWKSRRGKAWVAAALVFLVTYPFTSQEYVIAQNRLGGLVPPMFTISKSSKISLAVDDEQIPIHKGVIQQSVPTTVLDAFQIFSEQNDTESINRIVDNYFELQQELWRRGVFDKDPFFHQNHGLNNLTELKQTIYDIGGLTTNSGAAIIHFWRARYQYRNQVIAELRLRIPEESVQYYVKRFDEVFVFDNFRRLWNSGQPIPAEVLDLEKVPGVDAPVPQHIAIEVDVSNPEARQLREYVNTGNFLPFQAADPALESYLFKSTLQNNVLKVERTLGEKTAARIPSWRYRHQQLWMFMMSFYIVRRFIEPSFLQSALERLGGLMPPVFVIKPEHGVSLQYNGVKRKVKRGYLQQTQNFTVSQALKILNKDAQSPANRQQVFDLIDSYFELQAEMWRRGIFDRDLSFTKNYGISDHDITKMLVFDLGRLTPSPTLAYFWLLRAPYLKNMVAEQLRRDVFPEAVEYYSRKFDEFFTIRNFNRLWNSGTPVPAELIDISQTQPPRDVTIADIGEFAGDHRIVNDAVSAGRIEKYGMLRDKNIFIVKGVDTLDGRQSGHAGILLNSVYVAEGAVRDQKTGEIDAGILEELALHEAEELVLWQSFALELSGISPNTEWNTLPLALQKIVRDRLRSWIADSANKVRVEELQREFHAEASKKAPVISALEAIPDQQIERVQTASNGQRFYLVDFPAANTDEQVAQGVQKNIVYVSSDAPSEAAYELVRFRLWHLFSSASLGLSAQELSSGKLEEWLKSAIRSPDSSGGRAYSFLRERIETIASRVRQRAAEWDTGTYFDGGIAQQIDELISQIIMPDAVLQLLQPQEIKEEEITQAAPAGDPIETIFAERRNELLPLLQDSSVAELTPTDWIAEDLWQEIAAQDPLGEPIVIRIHGTPNELNQMLDTQLAGIEDNRIAVLQLTRLTGSTTNIRLIADTVRDIKDDLTNIKAGWHRTKNNLFLLSLDVFRDHNAVRFDIISIGRGDQNELRGRRLGARTFANAAAIASYYYPGIITFYAENPIIRRRFETLFNARTLSQSEFEYLKSNLPLYEELFPKELTGIPHGFLIGYMDEPTELLIADIGLRAGSHRIVNEAIGAGMLESVEKVEGRNVFIVKGVNTLDFQQRAHGGILRNAVYIAEGAVRDDAAGLLDQSKVTLYARHEGHELSRWQQKALALAGLDSTADWEELRAKNPVLLRMIRDNLRRWIAAPENRDEAVRLMEQYHTEANTIAGVEPNDSMLRVFQHGRLITDSNGQRFYTMDFLADDDVNAVFDGIQSNVLYLTQISPSNVAYSLMLDKLWRMFGVRILGIGEKGIARGDLTKWMKAAVRESGSPANRVFELVSHEFNRIAEEARKEAQILDEQNYFDHSVTATVTMIINDILTENSLFELVGEPEPEIEPQAVADAVTAITKPHEFTADGLFKQVSTLLRALKKWPDSQRKSDLVSILLDVLASIPSESHEELHLMRRMAAWWYLNSEDASIRISAENTLSKLIGSKVGVNPPYQLYEKPLISVKTYRSPAKEEKQPTFVDTKSRILQDIKTLVMQTDFVEESLLSIHGISTETTPIDAVDIVYVAEGSEKAGIRVDVDLKGIGVKSFMVIIPHKYSEKFFNQAAMMVAANGITPSEYVAPVFGNISLVSNMRGLKLNSIGSFYTTSVAEGEVYLDRNDPAGALLRKPDESVEEYNRRIAALSEVIADTLWRIYQNFDEKTTFADAVMFDNNVVRSDNGVLSTQFYDFGLMYHPQFSYEIFNVIYTFLSVSYKKAVEYSAKDPETSSFLIATASPEDIIDLIIQGILAREPVQGLLFLRRVQKDIVDMLMEKTPYPDQGFLLKKNDFSSVYERISTFIGVVPDAKYSEGSGNGTGNVVFSDAFSTARLQRFVSGQLFVVNDQIEHGMTAVELINPDASVALRTWTPAFAQEGASRAFLEALEAEPYQAALAAERLGGIVPPMTDFELRPIAVTHEGLTYTIHGGFLQKPMDSSFITMLRQLAEKNDTQSIHRLFDSFFYLQERMWSVGVFDTGDDMIISHYGVNDGVAGDVRLVTFTGLKNNLANILDVIPRDVAQYARFMGEFIRKRVPELTDDHIDYFISRYERVFTIENFDRLWNSEQPLPAERLDYEAIEKAQMHAARMVHSMLVEHAFTEIVPAVKDEHRAQFSNSAGDMVLEIARRPGDGFARSIVIAKNRLGGLVPPMLDLSGSNSVYNDYTIREGYIRQDSRYTLKQAVKILADKGDKLALNRLIGSYFSMIKELWRRGVFDIEFARLDHFGVEDIDNPQIKLIRFGQLQPNYSETMVPFGELRTSYTETQFNMFRSALADEISALQDVLPAENHTFFIGRLNNVVTQNNFRDIWKTGVPQRAETIRLDSEYYRQQNITAYRQFLVSEQTYEPFEPSYKEGNFHFFRTESGAYQLAVSVTDEIGLDETPDSEIPPNVRQGYLNERNKQRTSLRLAQTRLGGIVPPIFNLSERGIRINDVEIQTGYIQPAVKFTVAEAFQQLAERGDQEKIDRLIDNLITLQQELWRRGVAFLDYQLLMDSGVTDLDTMQLVVLQIGDLTAEPVFVQSQISALGVSLRRVIPQSNHLYFLRAFREGMSKETFDRLWNTGISYPADQFDFTVLQQEQRIKDRELHQAVGQLDFVRIPEHLVSFDERVFVGRDSNIFLKYSSGNDFDLDTTPVSDWANAMRNRQNRFAQGAAIGLQRLGGLVPPMLDITHRSVMLNGEVIRAGYLQQGMEYTFFDAVRIFKSRGDTQSITRLIEAVFVLYEHVVRRGAVIVDPAFYTHIGLNNLETLDVRLFNLNGLYAEQTAIDSMSRRVEDSVEAVYLELRDILPSSDLDSFIKRYKRFLNPDVLRTQWNTEEPLPAEQLKIAAVAVSPSSDEESIVASNALLPREAITGVPAAIDAYETNRKIQQFVDLQKYRRAGMAVMQRDTAVYASRDRNTIIKRVQVPQGDSARQTAVAMERLGGLTPAMIDLHGRSIRIKGTVVEEGYIQETVGFTLKNALEQLRLQKDTMAQKNLVDAFFAAHEALWSKGVADLNDRINRDWGIAGLAELGIKILEYDRLTTDYNQAASYFFDDSQRYLDSLIASLGINRMSDEIQA